MLSGVGFSATRPQHQTVMPSSGEAGGKAPAEGTNAGSAARPRWLFHPQTDSAKQSETVSRWHSPLSQVLPRLRPWSPSGGEGESAPLPPPPRTDLPRSRGRRAEAALCPSAGTNVRQREWLKWSETPQPGSRELLQILLLAHEPSAGLVSGPGQSHPRRAPCHPPARERAPGPSTTPGTRHSLLAAALPGVAFGHFTSLLGLVIHSAQTAEKGSIKSKAPPAKPRAELGPGDERSSTCPAHCQLHACCQPSVGRPFPTTQENFKGSS